MTNSWVLIFFNLLFTSVPPLIYGILDRDTPAETLMELPELYQAAQTSKVTAHTQDTTHKPCQKLQLQLLLFSILIIVIIVIIVGY